MGCDIHLAVEVRKDGQWRRALPPTPMDEWLVECAEKYPNDKWYQRRVVVTWYNDRNYDLFGMLANVRNGRGFAGIITGGGFNPISMPRGLPDDLSKEVLAITDQGRNPEDDSDDGDIFIGDHSHSWLSLRELIEYDWQQTTSHCGWVDAEQYKVFCKRGKPEEWCGGVSGGSVQHLSNDEMATRIAAGFEHSATEDCYTLVKWKETYAESAGRFYTVVLPALKDLAEREGVSHDDVRIVFAFDS